ncbi:hypothetical protein [Pseudomonas asplenii]|uniref:Uncharacterized protein n=1 Tax=Pseudomonas asplenii TaxID=53407 RepID=A0A1H6P100_9PSED|nr:hypothetical protein [Pseudomonas fuscovaginae]SEI17247.1 hypothetical protein SAMN05216581_3338 [Pseudomonas fuscovaginae]SEI23608.1 hypothetical protein SAMN05216581_5235 [Pseudomonas fuscovaginae]
MQFVNNWIAQLSAEFGAADKVLPLPSAALSRLASGDYLLTLVDSANSIEQTAWEVMLVKVAAGVATATRGQEGTLARSWPVGSLIYCSVTAGTISGLFNAVVDLQQRVNTLEGGGPGPVDPGTDGALTDSTGNTLVDGQGNPLISGA